MSNAFDTSVAATKEPTEIIAGDFTAWRRTDLQSDYPNDLYTLSYQARRDGVPAREIAITASASGDEYLVSLSSAITLAYPVGHFYWSAYITRDSDSARVQIASGEWTVKPDRVSNSDDPAGLAKRMLTLIEAAIEARATNNQLDVLSYALGVESSATRDPALLLKHRAYWKRELVSANRRARARQGKSSGSKIGVQF